MTMDLVQFSVSGHVATLTLDRPSKLNAITPEMTTEIRSIVDDINADEDISVVILTGTGKAFRGGGDIKDLATYPPPWLFRDRPDGGAGIRSVPKPVVAAI